MLAITYSTKRKRIKVPSQIEHTKKIFKNITIEIKITLDAHQRFLTDRKQWGKQ